ncbi:hypothetical protein EOD41_08755 [Mucilaginibacter limnophilus]|uniref:Outer membrane protein beta-barrel domain-containing protein n=1 Tax=Mucilaginibacter limnophilus TaxID=1932778 RepID=A0A437MWM1_9SPHI|nr:outer membrane beta-barrel protein [Mucilaginibacter limnophilus]RVU02029.1 hypothetical protein EOD41_08755 [Mucilaginibacter limnophilus]
MRLLTRCVLSLVLGMIFNYSYAQTDSTGIQGRILTEFSAPAEAATVRLLSHPDSILISSTITDKNGFFQFNRIKPGNYFIAVTKVGYKRLYSIKYQILANSSVKAASVRLVPLTHQLQEVKIQAKKDYVEVRPDKTIVNVDKSIVAAGSNMLDVLGGTPGVRVSGDEVLFKGGQKALIAVNGKPVLLSSEQLAELLRNYQSSQVSQVELIENPSARWDAAGGGVINIILKKDQNLGWRVNINETAAIGQNYRLTSSTAVNYRSRKLNLFATYTVGRSETTREWDINRNIQNNGATEGYDVNYRSNIRLSTHSFNTGGELSFNPKQSLGALVQGNINPTGIGKRNNTYLMRNGITDSTITTGSFIDRDVSNINYNLNYRGVFGKFGEHTLSADADYIMYDRASVEDLTNNFYNASGSFYRDPLKLYITSPSDIDVYSFKIDYTRLIDKISNVDIGFKTSKVKSINRIDFNRVDGNSRTLVDSLTGRFNYNERINAGYVNYVRRMNNVSITAGLRGEMTMADRVTYNPANTADTSYFNIFPSVIINYDLNDDHQLSFSYNRRIERPNYQDLNPFVAYIDKYAYSTGNPYLRPQYRSSFQISDIFLYKFRGSLAFNVTKDFYTNIFQQDNATGVYTTVTANIGTRHQYMAEIRAPFKIGSWWDINAYAQGTYERFLYKTPGAANKAAYDLIVQVNQQFKITDKVSAELYTSYETPTYFGIKYYREQYFVNAGVSRGILSNKGSIKLQISDIFNTRTYRYNTTYLNLDLHGREKSGTRFVTLNFSYRFGNDALKNARKRTGGSQDERNRLGD